METTRYTHGKIDSLESLRIEKKKLRAHIALADKKPGQEAEGMPAQLLKFGLSKAGENFGLTGIGNVAKGLAGSMAAQTAGKVLLGGFAKETAVYAGIRLASMLLRRWRK